MALLRPPPTKPAAATLAERIEQVQAEITALIEDFCSREKAENPTLPLEWIKQNFRARFGSCLCNAYKAGPLEKQP